MNVTSLGMRVAAGYLDPDQNHRVQDGGKCSRSFIASSVSNEHRNGDKYRFSVS